MKRFLVYIAGLEYQNNGEPGNGGGYFEWRTNKKAARKVFSDIRKEAADMKAKEPNVKVKTYSGSLMVEADKNDIKGITQQVEAYLEKNNWEYAFPKGTSGATQRSPFAPGS